MRTWRTSVATGLVMATTWTAIGAEMSLTVREPGASARGPARTTTGIPFARGELQDVGRLAVSVGGRTVPAQFRAHVPWDDGSVRWALMDVQAPVGSGESVELTVTTDGGNPAPATRVTVEENAERVRVATGSLIFDIPKTRGGLLGSVQVAGKTLVDAAGRGAVVTLPDGREIVAGAPDEVAVEESGPMRATIRVRGVFPDVHDGLLRYTARITARAGQPDIGVHYWLENHGAMGYGDAKPEWFSFRSMAIEFGLGLGDTVTAACESVQAENAFRLLQVCHMAKDREVRGGGPFYRMEDFEYTLVSGETVLKTGERTDGAVELRGANGRLVTAVREFWQNYEKAIALAEGRLRLELWPAEGRWPKQRPGRWEGSDGLKDKHLIAMALDNELYRLSGGLHKGHEFVLDFSDRTAEEVLAELNKPLHAFASGERYAATHAWPGLFAPAGARVERNREANFKLASWERMQRSASDSDNPVSLFAARQAPWSGALGYWGAHGQSFGWMDFGDIGVPGRGVVGVDDWSHIMLINALRFGDEPSMRLGSQMARHIVDIDQHWSDRDLPRNRGLQKRGGGARFAIFPEFHSTQLQYAPRLANLVSGVVLHYMLTGQPKSREAGLRYAHGLTTAWEGAESGGITSAAHSISALGATYEMTGDRRWLDEALKLFNTHIMALRQRHGPHLHSGQQIQGQGYARQDQAYCLAIQYLCEFHHVSRDAQVMKLLEEACEREFDDRNFFDAPTYLSGLFAYVGLRTGNDEYLAQAARLFAQSFPESRSPPVFLTGNSVWHESVHMLRSGYLLQYAWWAKGRSPQ